MEEVRREKRAMRAGVRARLRAMRVEERHLQEDTIQGLFPGLPGLDRAETVLLYASAFPEEFPTGPLMAWVIAAGKRLVCPRVDLAAGRLALHRLDDLARDLVATGRWGIPEPVAPAPLVPPEAIDWALVPGLAFDGRGHRLGRGGGYYDRLLPTLRPDCPRWALAFDEQWVEAVPVGPHDERVSGVASPGRVCHRD